MVVFRDHEQQSVGTRNSGGKLGVLEGFTCIVKSEAEVAQINELRFDTLALLYFFKHKVGDIFTRPTLSCGAQDYRDEEWSIGHQVSNGISDFGFRIANFPFMKADVSNDLILSATKILRFGHMKSAIRNPQSAIPLRS